MFILAGVAALAVAGAGTDVESLARLWAGIHDSSEEVFVGAEASVGAWGEGQERRIRTSVAKISVPQLGPQVLYLEEFPHDDPQNVRRQLLLVLEPAQPPQLGVHALVFAFRDPAHWAHLNRRTGAAASVQLGDLVKAEGCDLYLKREGDQFSGGTLGKACLDVQAAGARYVQLQLVIGEDLYWYRRRTWLRKSDELQEEVVGFNWFELNDARLFACRVDWSATGRARDLRPIAHLDLHDQGGHARFATPDGRNLELTLHSQDWPYMADRDALILLLQDQAQSAPLASSWSEIDSDDISIDLGWLKVYCGSMVPNTDELWSSLTPSVGGPPYQRVDVAQQDRIEFLRRLHHEELPGVGHYVGPEIRQRLADTGLIGGIQIGVDGQHRHVDAG